MPSVVLSAIFLAMLMAVAPLNPITFAAETSIALTSPAFTPGSTIPRAYTCTDADKSPPLTWRGVPANAKTIALVVDDPDAPAHTWVHWVLYDLPASATRLGEGIAKTATLDDGADQGVNDFGKIGYNGPCPPPGRVHHYHFRLFALDSELILGANTSASDLENAVKGHVIATAELIGTFGR